MESNNIELLTNDQIESMKVAELKKALKSRGLSVIGIKNDLIIRLQESILESDADLLDEDKALMVEEDKILEGDDLVPSPDLLQSPDIKETLTEPDFEEALEPKTTAIKRPISDVEGNEENDLSTSKIAKLSSLSSMTPSERQALRSEKFNKDAAVAAESQANRLEQRAKRFNIEKDVAAKTGSASIDVLKKRAERFGDSVSPIVKDLESKEKLLKRIERFGPIELERKSLIDKDLSSKQKIKFPGSVDSDEMEAKKLLRKQRFNM